MKNHQPLVSEDQHWRAFQYVAGELSATEVELFELQMLDDISLCDAVLEVIRQTSAIAACRKTPHFAARSLPLETLPVAATGHRAIAALTAVCCCIVIGAIAARFASTSPGHDGQMEFVTAGETTEAEFLVDLWADGFPPGRSTDVEADDSMQQDLDVPEWMLAAVSLAVAEDSSDAPTNVGTDDMEWF